MTEYSQNREDESVRSLWQLRVHANDGRQVFRKIIGDSYHNACWWMRDNIDEVQAVLDDFADHSPKVILEDVYVSSDN